MTKTIKISEEAHTALEVIKAIDNIKIGEFVSELILLEIEKRHKKIFEEIMKKV